jgi:hypothetical protein
MHFISVNVPPTTLKMDTYPFKIDILLFDLNNPSYIAEYFRKQCQLEISAGNRQLAC